MSGHRNDPQTILITGALSGTGKALALADAGPGHTLFLLDRDRSRLAAGTTACQDNRREN